MLLCNVTVSITLSHYPTMDPTRREQGPINSREVTVFTTDYFLLLLLLLVLQHWHIHIVIIIIINVYN